MSSKKDKKLAQYKMMRYIISKYAIQYLYFDEITDEEKFKKQISDFAQIVCDKSIDVAKMSQNDFRKYFGLEPIKKKDEIIDDIIDELDL